MVRRTETQVSRGKTKKKPSAKKKTILPEKQWEMPAGFTADGIGHATLRDVVDPDVPTLQLSDLSLEQRAELVAKRLELQPQINLAMIGAGLIDKSRAITEVKNRTKVGKLLIEIEHQMIRNLLEQAQKNAAATHPRPNARRKTAAKKA
jgi:hypothetical protein